MRKVERSQYVQGFERLARELEEEILCCLLVCIKRYLLHFDIANYKQLLWMSQISNLLMGRIIFWM